MKKKFLILGTAIGLIILQSAYAVAAPSSRVDTTGTVTVINRVNGTTTTINPSGNATTNINDEGVPLTGGTVDINDDTVPLAGMPGLAGTTTTIDENGVPLTSKPIAPVAIRTAQGNVTMSVVEPTAAPTVAVETIQGVTSWSADKAITSSSAFTTYAPEAAMAIQTVNANPAALSALKSREGLDLNKYGMLTEFQELAIMDAAGQISYAQEGQCLSLEIKTLQPGMAIYMLYVDPVTNMVEKIQIPGVDYVNQLVLIDARFANAAFSIVYEKAQ